jgi:hypothetical protein
MASGGKRSDEYSAATSYLVALRKIAPAIYAGLRDDSEPRIREFGVQRTADGRWLAKAKSATMDGRPVIAWGQGADVAAALAALNRSVQNKGWRQDKFPGSRWAL